VPTTVPRQTSRTCVGEHLLHSGSTPGVRVDVVRGFEGAGGQRGDRAIVGDL